MHQNEVKISIITINYNNAEGLEKTIVSILNQSYKNIEYIIIDGGSTDSSNVVIEKHSDKLDYWVMETDKGIYNAMNKGIERATGNYLLFINSGDSLVDDNVLESAISMGLDADLVYGNLYYLGKERKREWVPEEKLSFQTFLLSTIPHPCTLIKRQLFDSVGKYNEQLKIVSDWEFFVLAICKYNFTYKHIHLFITDFLEDGISSNPESLKTIADERDTVMKKHFPLFLQDYKELLSRKEEMRKIRYFLRLRAFFKRLLNQNN